MIQYRPRLRDQNLERTTSRWLQAVSAHGTLLQKSQCPQAEASKRMLLCQGLKSSDIGPCPCNSRPQSWTDHGPRTVGQLGLRTANWRPERFAIHVGY